MPNAISIFLASNQVTRFLSIYSKAFNSRKSLAYVDILQCLSETSTAEFTSNYAGFLVLFCSSLFQRVYCICTATFFYCCQQACVLSVQFCVVVVSYDDCQQLDGTRNCNFVCNHLLLLQLTVCTMLADVSEENTTS